MELDGVWAGNLAWTYVQTIILSSPPGYGPRTSASSFCLAGLVLAGFVLAGLVDRHAEEIGA